MTETLVLIPARMHSTRLPGKPMADIAGEPMIVHVWRRAMESRLGRVVVATDAPEVVAAIEAAGGVAVRTRSDHPSGSDRIREAADIVDPEKSAGMIVNLQGDFPTIEPATIRHAAELLSDPAVDIGTLAAIIHDEEEKTNPNVVKAIGAALSPNRMRALYFTRATAPHGDGPLYHHIGLYAFRRAALDRYVALPPSPLEQRERLEQLRALENEMRIDIAVIDSVPRGVDTPADLERARAALSSSASEPSS